jgi:hypothetical protein
MGRLVNGITLDDRATSNVPSLSIILGHVIGLEMLGLNADLAPLIEGVDTSAGEKIKWSDW